MAAAIASREHLVLDLQEKYFEVNYSDGMVQLDKWFRSFHDGTPEAHQRMKKQRALRA